MRGVRPPILGVYRALGGFRREVTPASRAQRGGQRLHTVVSSTTTTPASIKDSNPESSHPVRASRSQVQVDFSSPPPAMFWRTAERPQPDLRTSCLQKLVWPYFPRTSLGHWYKAIKPFFSVPGPTHNSCLRATKNLPASSKERTAIAGATANGKPWEWTSCLISQWKQRSWPNPMGS